MFSKQIIDSDVFLEMPLSTQALYFHLSMRADDDGFVDNPKKIQRMINASGDDLKLLIAKRYILTFESGVVVIKHWLIHNTLRTDRYKETVYLEEKSTLLIKENKAYTEKDKLNSIGLPNGNQMEPQYSIDKDSIDKIKEDIPDDKSSSHTQKHKFGEYQHVLLKDDELSKLKSELGDDLTDKTIKFLDEYIEMKGYKAKSHYLCIRKWVVNAVKERDSKPVQQQQKPSNNKFNNFPQRDYDYDALEKELLGNNG